MDEQNIVLEFFSLKFLQVASSVLSKIHFNLAYTGDDIDAMQVDIKYRMIKEGINERLNKFIEVHYEYLETRDLNEDAKEYNVTLEMQRKLTKEEFGKEYTIDDLYELIKD